MLKSDDSFEVQMRNAVKNKNSIFGVLCKTQLLQTPYFVILACIKAWIESRQLYLTAKNGLSFHYVFKHSVALSLECHCRFIPHKGFYEAFFFVVTFLAGSLAPAVSACAV